MCNRFLHQGQESKWAKVHLQNEFQGVIICFYMFVLGEVGGSR